MNDLGILRSALFDEIKRLKRGTADIEETNAIVKTSNAIISTYQLEVKTAELIINAQEKGIEIKEVTVFNDSNHKTIDYVGKEDEED